jgi:1,4-dihydroxy-2-naphthoate octaprenyltransferase
MFRIWIQAARLRTLPAAVAPVLLGIVLAISDGGFHVASATAALIGALIIQVGTNFANDYFDFIKGTDNEDRIGPPRATQAGLIKPRTMKIAFIITFTSLLPFAVYLSLRGGWPLAVIGILSVICGILYTGGPKPLGYLGLGDVFVLVFFGPVAVWGTYYVQTQSMVLLPVIVGLAPGAISTAILVVNNLRDKDTDVHSGKLTLAVRFGEKFARIEYTGCLVLAAFVPVYLAVMNQGPWTACLSLGFVLPAVPILKSMWQESGADLDKNLGKTGKLLVVYCVLFAIGWSMG